MFYVTINILVEGVEERYKHWKVNRLFTIIDTALIYQKYFLGESRMLKKNLRVTKLDTCHTF